MWWNCFPADGLASILIESISYNKHVKPSGAVILCELYVLLDHSRRHDGSGKIAELLDHWADLPYKIRRFCYGKEENCFTAQNNQTCVPDKWILITCLSAKLLDCAYKSRLGLIGICNPGLEMKPTLFLWFPHHQYWWASFPASSAEFFSWLLSPCFCPYYTFGKAPPVSNVHTHAARGDPASPSNC